MGKRRGKKIGVDFDGVIHQYDRGFQGGECYGKPVEGAFSNLWLLHKRGLQPFIFTTRADEKIYVEEMRRWFGEWLPIKHNTHKFRGAELEEVEEFFEEIEITNIKKGAIAYIDDRAIRFTNWSDMRKYFC